VLLTFLKFVLPIAMSEPDVRLPHTLKYKRTVLNVLSDADQHDVNNQHKPLVFSNNIPTVTVLVQFY
jgi:hypothetical protein